MEKNTDIKEKIIFKEDWRKAIIVLIISILLALMFGGISYYYYKCLSEEQIAKKNEKIEIIADNTETLNVSKILEEEIEVETKSAEIIQQEEVEKVEVKKQTTTNTSKATSSSKTKDTSKTNSNNVSTNANSKVTQPNDSSTKNGRLQIATEEAKKIVFQIIEPGMSDYDKAFAIFMYLYYNVSTQYNQSTTAYQTNYGNEAYAALIMKQAACSGFCKAVTLMCNAAGLQSKHINANQWTHQWNTVLINGEWIILDAQGGIFGGTVHPLEY